MKTRYVILSILSILVLVGCGTVRVPANTIRIKSPRGTFSVTHPQDFTGSNVVVSLHTNGTLEAKFDYIHTANSPEVIDKVAAGQVAVIKAQGDVAEKLFRAGVEATAKGAKTAVVP